MALKFHRNFKMEGYWSVFRHWMDTYRGVSKEHLPEYVSFFEFVENHKREGWLYVFHQIIFWFRLWIGQICTYIHTNPCDFNVSCPSKYIATASFT